MKLYATTTSERASKGQGGNDRLYIDVNIGDIKNMFTFQINRSPTLKGYMVTATYKNKKILDEIVYHCYEEENKSKGKQKKDEVCKHGQPQATCATCQFIERTK